MANTINPKAPPTVPSTRAAEARPNTPAVATQASTPTAKAGWQPGVTGKPSAAAQAIAPGSGNKEIICPVLRAMVNEGRVQMKPDGSVKLDELNKAVRDLGGTRTLGAASWGIGGIGNKPSDILRNFTHGEMNVVNLPEGIVPHPADTGILRSGKFDEAKFNALASHAENGVITTDGFARAIADNYRRDVNAGAPVIDSTVRGLNFAQLEFAGLLSVFGKKDPATGKTGIKVDDLRVLYEKGTIPPGMLGGKASVVETLALQASLAIKSDANVAKGAMASVFTATGLASAGARLAGAGPAESERTAGQLASMGAGKAASCPHMAGAKKMPTNPPDVVNAHTPAGVGR